MITNHHHKAATIYKSWQPITFPWQDTNKTLPKQEGEYVFLLLILIPERHFSMHWVQDWKLLSHYNTCIKKILKGGFHESRHQRHCTKEWRCFQSKGIR